MPDHLEVIPDGDEKRSSSGGKQHERSTSIGEMPIPKTVVEKVDPTSPSHGDVPGTAAHSMRRADAVPDVIRPTSEHEESSADRGDHQGISPKIPIPKTVITKVDSNPSHGEVPGTEAFDIRQGDARPDAVEKKGDVTGT